MSAAALGFVAWTTRLAAATLPPPLLAPPLVLASTLRPHLNLSPHPFPTALQRQALSLYRSSLRAAREKAAAGGDSLAALARSEFEK